MTDLFTRAEETVDSYECQDWQQEDIEYLSAREYSANWSEMGAYKTTTGLWLMDRFRQSKEVVKQGFSEPHTLIVTSKAGKGTYFDAFPKTIPDWQLFNVDTKHAWEMFLDIGWQVDLPAALDPPGWKPTCVLAHYDIFSRKGIVRDKLQRVRWDMIILDEAHRMKNYKALWTKEIKKCEAPIRHVMTGTPFINNPAEMWSLLNFLDKTRWKGYWDFREYYCDEWMDGRGFRHILGTKAHRVEEFRALQRSIGVRRLMADVHKDIDHPIEATRTVELNATQRRMYKEIKATLSTMDSNGEMLRSPSVLSQLTRLRQITVATPIVESKGYDARMDRMVTKIKLVEPSSKLDDVMDILGEIDPQYKVVVFSAFKDPLFLLEARLAKAGIPYLHMLEKHSETERYTMWHDTFPKGEHRVFMSTLALGGESINLTPAKYLIFLDRSWSPKDMMQAIGRVYRPGQKHVPEIIYINANKTTDQYMKTKLDLKGKWFKEIFGKEE